MMEYKVCFHISYTPYWLNERREERRTPTGRVSKQRVWHGKMHYSGHTLAEAVDKIRPYLERLEQNNRGYCTSMWIMRGRERGRNIKWADYNQNA